MESERMKRLKEARLIGCLNDTGVTSENYKNFHDQPDSSKREDSWKDRSMTNSQYEEFVKMTNKYMRCGTRNNQETD